MKKYENGELFFYGPYDPSRGFENDFSAVYAIVDGLSRLIDIGQTESFNNRIPNHDRKLMWPKHAQQGHFLYVLLEPNESMRLQIERVIRQTYNPPCGEK